MARKTWEAGTAVREGLSLGGEHGNTPGRPEGELNVDGLVGIPEAARKLGIPKKTVSGWYYRDKKLGGRRDPETGRPLVDQFEVAALLAARVAKRSSRTWDQATASANRGGGSYRPPPGAAGVAPEHWFADPEGAAQFAKWRREALEHADSVETTTRRAP